MKAIDMTTGSAAKKILLFSLPIFLGNVFQQIYGLSDAFVVGRFLGTAPMASIGASAAFITFINSILIGLCMGSGVLFSSLYGAKNHKELSSAISTAAIFILSMTCFVSLMSIAFLNKLLHIFQVPQEAMPLARDYLIIILSGLPFMALYNIGAAVLRSVGDSKTPLLFLIVSSVVNVAFDFILVLWIPMGVRGPALSTFAAQLFSGLPLCVYAIRKLGFIRLSLRFERVMFRKVAQYSVLTSLQQSIMNFGILMVQGLVNSFGVVAMAAFSAGVRIDAFGYMPAQDFGNAFATYAAQNKGAGKADRIYHGFRSAIICTTVFCALVTALVWAFAPQLIAIFLPGDAEAIAAGAQYLRIEGAFYILIGYLFLFYALYRGLGHFHTSIALTVVSLGIRVVLSYLLVGLGFGMTSIWWSIPIGWAVADLVGMMRYRKLVKNQAILLETDLIIDKS